MGVDGFQEESRQPKTSAHRKVFPQHERLIAQVRKCKLGHRRLHSELARSHDLLSFPMATIHEALERIKKPHLNRSAFSEKS